MRVLVTGHAGYVGGALTDHLRSAGHAVVGFDRSADAADDVRDHGRVRAVLGDADPDLVYHLAADADVWTDDWRHLVENNVMGIVNVADAARAAELPVVFASSVAATGSFNRYGRSKAIAETTVEEYERVTTLRFPNVVGGAAPRGQAQAMVEQGLDGEVEVWGQGELRRSYVDVRDLARFLEATGARAVESTSAVYDEPTAVYGHTATNRALGECVQEAVEAETGARPDLTLVSRSPPSPRVLTGEDVRVEDPTPLADSIRSQVRAAIER